MDFLPRLARESPCTTASAHKAAASPSNHLCRRVFTSLRISLQRSLCPEAGEAKTHFANANRLVHLERLSGVLMMKERQLLRVRAYKYLAPIGTCWMVGMRHLRMEGRSGKMEELGGLQGLHCWGGRGQIAGDPLGEEGVVGTL